MALITRYAFQYDGARYFGSRVPYKLRRLADYWNLKWDAQKPVWWNCINIFSQLPDYRKRLVIVRERRKRVLCKSRYRKLVSRMVVE